MARGMELWRPDWEKLLRDCGGSKPDSEELVSITRETARLAMNALRNQNAQDAYHNCIAAEWELRDALRQ